MVRKRKVKKEEMCQSGASLTVTTRRNQRRFVCVYFIVFFFVCFFSYVDGGTNGYVEIGA